MPSGCQPFLTRRFDLALQFASGLHHTQCRKGTPVPYISHLMAVSAIVLEAGGEGTLPHVLAGARWHRLLRHQQEDPFVLWEM
jgi:hypothetical protein